MRSTSLRPVTILPQICSLQHGVRNCESTAVIEVFYCFTVAMVLPGDALDYNEDKSSAVAACMQNKVVVE